MNLKDATTIAGAFFMSFGEMLKTQAPSVMAYWIGQAMIVLGPLLLAGRAIKAK